MGATICYGSDRIPATVIQITNSGKRIILQEDIAIRTDHNGMSECQNYIYSRNLEGDVHIASLRKDGSFRISNSRTKVVIGVRQKYYDYSF